MESPDEPVIKANGLCKRYGDVVALDGVSFEVGVGEVLALLGPNGAGKTTAVKLVTTLATIDRGRAMVDGCDVASAPGAVRERIGVAGQAAAVDEHLTARENLEFFARLYKIGQPERGRRVEQLVERFDMASFADRPASSYSGGQRRRLDIAAALVARPAALFLDEPTTGLDPRSRSEVWDEVRSLANEGTAILLTTQYLDEADRLADRIVVIDHGHTVTTGTPEELKRKVGRDILDVRLTSRQDVERVLDEIELPGEVQVALGRMEVSIPIDGGPPQSLGLLRRIEEQSIEIADFSVRRPTLDDAFLALTGAPAGDRVEVPT